MRWYLICFFILSNHFCVAQQYYETYSPANGLVDARVNKIMQDETGRIFFLTKDGVSIYDGQRFSNHTKISGVPFGIINDGMQLPDGSLQLATFGGDWIHCKKNSASFDTILFKNIPEVSEIIPLPEGENLIVSNHGLFIYKNSHFRKIDLIAASAHGHRKVIEKIAVAGNYIVFSYSSNNKPVIYSCNKNTGVITDSLVIPSLYNIVSGDEQRIFICTSAGILQLNKDDLLTGKLKTEKPWFQQFLLKGFFAKNIFFDRQKNIWMIDEITGCRKINPLTGTTHTYSPGDGLLTGVTVVYQDKENNYWFIAPGKGVQKLVETNYEIVKSIGTNSIEQVYSSNTSEDSSVFFVTHKKMLVLKNDLVRELPKNMSSNPDHFFFWYNNYWTYASPNSLVSNNKKNVSLGNNSSINSVAHYPSPYITIDHSGNLLLGGNCISIVQQDFSASSQALPYFADNIVVDEKNNYWAFCRSNNIVKFSLANNELVKKASFLHPGMGPRFTIHWNKDTFCIATRSNGMLIAKVNDHSMSVIGQLTRQDGLSNDFVETLLRIDEKRIAAGTASGLDIITLAGADTLIENVSARINHFEPILQLSKDDKGMIYARTENYQLFKYNPFVTRSSVYQPGASFDRIIVNDQLTDIATTTFNHLKNNFLFSVTSPSFTDSRSIIFHFTLGGEKKEWLQESNKADFEISNLSPGKYTLTVVIKYPGRIYPDKKLEYQFTIRPPFWNTWWFIAALILIIILSALYFIRAYLKNQLHQQKVIMEKELAIEQERTRMARELHDGLGSMLSGIKHSFSAMKNQIELDKNQESAFHSNIDKLNESIKELRNISHSMASDSLLKYGLENSLRDYCHHIDQSGELSVSFTVLDTEKMILKEEQSFHIFRIVQELLQNSIKHSGASNAIIQISYNEKRLYITVEDNGRGFQMDEALRQKGIGLKNIESRIRILNGRMDYQTAPTKGTSVFIEIPCEEKK